MTDKVDKYLHTAIHKLNDRIEYFIEHYEPETLTIPGATTLNGSVTLGSDDSDLIVVNGQTTFNGDVVANNVEIDTLNLIDDCIIGEDGTDTLTINSNTTFNGQAIFDGYFKVNGDTIFGNTGADSMTSNGPITAPRLSVPTDSENSINIGSNQTIVYIERSSNINIYVDYPNSVIVVVKNSNLGATTISVTYNDEDSYHTLDQNTTYTYLKTSTDSFTRII